MVSRRRTSIPQEADLLIGSRRLCPLPDRGLTHQGHSPGGISPPKNLGLARKPEAPQWLTPRHADLFPSPPKRATLAIVVRMDKNTVTVDLGPNYEWVCQMQWPEGQTQGGPAVLVIQPSDPDNYPAGGISSTLLREVDFKAALETLRRQHASSKRWERARATADEKVTRRLLDHAEIRKLTDTYLALLARTYVSAVSQGQEKPLHYLAELTGKSHAAIKHHLSTATRRGLLERSHGRAGGTVTPKAARLIEQDL